MNARGLPAGCTKQCDAAHQTAAHSITLQSRQHVQACRAPGGMHLCNTYMMVRCIRQVVERQSTH